MEVVRQAAGRLLDLATNPKHGSLIAVFVVLFEVVLTTAIIWRVPYTEIDWVAYMQEVAGVVDEGDFDYANLRGDTGPLVYPGGFVWVFAVLRALTDNGANILAAQYIFQGIYLANLVVVLAIYVRSRSMPPYVLVLLCLSRRVHSIFVLRLFNDCVAMLFAHIAILLLLDRRRDIWASIMFSLAVGVKMNVLLFAPVFGLVLCRRGGVAHLVKLVALMAAIQLALGAPFILWGSARNYMNGAFDFGREFMFKWTVNLKFLGEELFLDKRVALGLLAAHILVLFVFFVSRWLFTSDGFLFGFIKRHFTGNSAGELTNDYIITALFTCNFIGICFSRSLHYQFYSWYWFTLPYLLWRTRAFTVVGNVLILAAIEVCWNVFPAQPWSSALLWFCHLSLLLALLFAPQQQQLAAADKAKTS